MSTSRWFYSGDASIEHGGMFYTLSSFDDGWSDVVRVQPCSDAGGPSNCYWIEQLTVTCDHALLAFSGVGDTLSERRAHRLLHHANTDQAARVAMYIKRAEDALICCGWDYKLPDWDKLSEAQRRHVLVDAFVSYGTYDSNSSEIVQVGREQAVYHTHEGGFKPATVLRGNTNLRKWVRSNKCV